MIVTLRRTLAPFAARAGAAVAAGYSLYLSFPPREWWFLAPLAIAALLITLRGRSIRAAVVLGYLGGLGFFVPLLPWVGEYVGPVPWLALAAAQAVAFAVFAACVPLLHSCRGAPIWIASAWVAVEAARSRLPFGGFPWGRIGFGQADGPLLSIASLGGAPGLSFVVVAMGSAIALAAVAVRTKQWHALALPAAIGISVAVVSVVPLSSGGGDRQISVALIQGNVPRLGLDFNAQRRAVLDNHVRKTLELANMIALGKSARPDFVLWPENSSDIDPYRNDDAFDQISTAARVIGVPIVVGAVIRSADGTTRNSSIVWDPKTGPGQTHDKRKLVPFGEYLPMRDLMIRLSSYAEQVGNFVAGSGNGVVEIGDVPIAVTTCYEVAFDGLVTQSVRAGAQLITVPTNNATFGRTEMTYQQLAMSRVRAVEHNRAVLIAATSGVSAVVDRDGTVVQRSGLFTADVLMARVALSSDLTVATRIGTVPEWLAVSVVVAFLAGAACRHRTRGKLP
ncbi:apolipoprotein N-acyltransferase [Williamsia herbipolensis]|uniref:apolipoprotein N-acyltransferase n=1 Tax=Williamsia herbipolensis TaxID=1603258 RepID=UPI000AE621DA|nr:apolipoprotein N-acyltransferase [Williamsia herbipolensis]